MLSAYGRRTRPAAEHTMEHRAIGGIAVGLVVCKFGGSSVADGPMFRRVLKIIRGDEERRYIVLSAPGKRCEDDFKVTDQLYQCHRIIREGKSPKDAFGPVEKRFQEIGASLSLEPELVEAALAEARDRLAAGAGEAASRGEYLCARLFSEYAKIPFVDAAEIVRFDAAGRPDEAATLRAARARLRSIPRAVIPGFYGAMPDGRIRTFRRGGSDVTGALVARAMDAECYENWTDVDGVLSADPRAYPDAVTTPRINYAQMGLLTRLGASVLHPDSIRPLFDADIPTRIRNTFRPEGEGTLITVAGRAAIPCVSGTDGMRMIRVYASCEDCLARISHLAPAEAVFSAYGRTDLLCRDECLDALLSALSDLNYAPPRRAAAVAVVWDGASSLAEVLKSVLEGMIVSVQHVQTGCLLLLTPAEAYRDVMNRLHAALGRWAENRQASV